jgi:hypothetical protein
MTLRPRVAAALVFGTVTSAVVAFQIALACGAPWGDIAMGGVSPGVLPPALRAAAIVQAVLLGTMILVVLARAGIAVPSWSRWSARLIWVVVAFAAVSTVLNAITPSDDERIVWLPVAIVMLISSVIVAFAPR